MSIACSRASEILCGSISLHEIHLHPIIYLKSQYSDKILGFFWCNRKEKIVPDKFG